MPLEKRQILPDRFRYACDSCSFDWPRTPVKESELPPPPAHSCRNQSPTEPKPVVEERVVEERVVEERRTKDNESARPKPVAVCTRCGAVSYAPNLINGQCVQMVAGKRCVGVNGSALNAEDWKQCTACAGAGSTGTARCGPCDGAGWLYARNKARR